MQAKKKILIVDDDKDTVKLVTKILENAGFEAEKSDGIDEAKLSLSRMKPDIILSDIGMPGEDGFQFLKFLKNSDELSAIPVLMLTGKAEIENVVHAVELGATGYILKPVEKEKILNRLEQALNAPSPDEEVEFAKGSKNSYASLHYSIRLFRLSDRRLTLISAFPLSEEKRVSLQGNFFQILEMKPREFKILSCEPYQGEYLVELDISNLDKAETQRLRKWRLRSGKKVERD